MRQNARFTMAVLGACATVALLTGCTTLGQKPQASFSSQQTAGVSPMAVDADIQRILSAGGIPSNDPVVAALQTPASASAWEADVQGAPVETPQQVASVTIPGTIGVETLPDNALVASPVTFPSTISAATGTAPLSAAIEAEVHDTGNPVLAPGITGGSSGGLPASMAAGILPIPMDMEEVVPVAQPVTKPAPARKMAPVPQPRPANLGQPAVAAVSTGTSSSPAAPVEAAPARPVVRRF